MGACSVFGGVGRKHIAESFNLIFTTFHLSVFSLLSRIDYVLVKYCLMYVLFLFDLVLSVRCKVSAAALT